VFLKPYQKYNKTTGERYSVYKLCEGYRSNGMVHHRIIVSLGRLEELEDIEQKKLLARRIEQLVHGGGNTLFPAEAEEKIEQLARYFYTQIKNKSRCNGGDAKRTWESVDLETITHRDARETGPEWLCKQAFDQLKIGAFLQQAGWDSHAINLAASHIICRAVYPASELKTLSYMRENSAICELTGVEQEKLTKDKLYGIAHKLYTVKHALEQYLSRRTNELFDLQDKIILYDLTNTYFEGRMKGSDMACFGRSKEKRNDARLVVLGMVINSEGFLKYSHIFQGNTADCETLSCVIDSLSRGSSCATRRPVVVMDAGIATDSNVAMLRQKGYDYLCVSRTSLKNYHADTLQRPVLIRDKQGNPIELLKVKAGAEADQYLWVCSQAKAKKENSMHGLLAQRFEEGIQRIHEGITKKGGTKKLEKVWERLGRLKQKYPSVHKYYDITLQDDGKGMATAIRCRHKTGEDTDKKAGVYFLRTSLTGNDEQTLWEIYNIIREVEYTFRVLKTDLDLRPVYHKTEEASLAHLHLGILAYWLVSTIRYQLKQKGFHHDWREIVRIMSTQKCVTTSVENSQNQTITIRQCTQPTKAVVTIYDLLNYKHFPFRRKKSVVPPATILKNKSP